MTEPDPWIDTPHRDDRYLKRKRLLDAQVDAGVLDPRLRDIYLDRTIVHADEVIMDDLGVRPNRARRLRLTTTAGKLGVPHPRVFPVPEGTVGPDGIPGGYDARRGKFHGVGEPGIEIGRWRQHAIEAGLGLLRWDPTTGKLVYLDEDDEVQ